MEHSLLLGVEALINLEFCVASQSGERGGQDPSLTPGWCGQPSSSWAPTAGGSDLPPRLVQGAKGHVSDTYARRIPE